MSSTGERVHAREQDPVRRFKPAPNWCGQAGRQFVDGGTEAPRYQDNRYQDDRYQDNRYQDDREHSGRDSPDQGERD